MPLLVRQKLVSADCACAGALARADTAASAKHAGETILAKLFIWFLPVFFWFVVFNTSSRPLFRRENEAAILAKKKAPRNEPQRLPRHVEAISWSAGSPRVPNLRRDGGIRSQNQMCTGGR